MKKMKISFKMMLWYTLLTSVLLGVFLPILYHAIEGSLLSNEKNLLEKAMSQTIMSIEFENNMLSTQDKIMVPADILTIIWDKNKTVIYSNTNEKWLYELYYMQGNTQRVRIEGSEWLVSDNTVQNEGIDVARIRVCTSLEGMESALRRTLWIIFAILPVYFIVTIVGGLMIAKKALRPISKITDIVNEIELKDLSKRITGVTCADEVGELADTFNRMLGQLERTFEKEKRFASDASHELRTPVTVIMAHAEAVLAEEDGEEIKRSIAAILMESKRMNIIIAQLLMLTRGMEGKYKPQFELTSLNMITEAVLEQLEEEAAHELITLSDTTEKEIKIEMDQSLITQMMLNIIGNAIKYGRPNGHIQVKADYANGKASLTISDNGIGIAPEALPHIFDRFFRADHSRDRSGSGLGLSIVKWIVEEHQGAIEVESTLGVGTTFIIWLNREQPKAVMGAKMEIEILNASRHGIMRF